MALRGLLGHGAQLSTSSIQRLKGCFQIEDRKTALLTIIAGTLELREDPHWPTERTAGE